LHLRSDVTLDLAAGTVLVASPDEADFDPCETLPYVSADDRETTYFHCALLAGEGLQRVTIAGEGSIDGNRSKRGGPKPLALKQCTQVTVRGITIRNSPNYAVSLLGCDHVVLDAITILNGYADGIDPDNCRDVRISGCSIDSADDAIVLKASTALGRRAATEGVTITN